MTQSKIRDPSYTIWFGAFFGALMANLLSYLIAEVLPPATTTPLYQLSPAAGYLGWTIGAIFFFGLFSALIFGVFGISYAFVERMSSRPSRK